jgi:hypothetical protein
MWASSSSSCVRSTTRTALRRCAGMPRRPRFAGCWPHRIAAWWMISRAGSVGYLVLTWGYSLVAATPSSTNCTWLRATEAGLGRQAVGGPRTPAGPRGQAVHLEVEIDNERAHALYHRAASRARTALMTKRLSVAGPW